MSRCTCGVDISAGDVMCVVCAHAQLVRNLPGAVRCIPPPLPEEDKALVERKRWTTALTELTEAVWAEGDTIHQVQFNQLVITMMLKMSAEDDAATETE